MLTYEMYVAYLNRHAGQLDRLRARAVAKDLFVQAMRLEQRLVETECKLANPLGAYRVYQAAGRPPIEVSR